ncbi:MAG: hypothetical protein ACK4UT_05810 [Moraxellaceae bacterium]
MTTAAVTDGGEGRRQAYLAALGLPLWTPRLALPGAQPSGGLRAEAWYRVDVPADPPPVPAEVRPAMAETPVTASGVERTAASPAAIPVSSPVSSPAVVADLPGAGAMPLRFRWLARALAPGWLVVVNLHDLPDLSNREHALLTAIAQALGASPDFVGKSSALKWPPVSNPRLDQDRAAARDWLAHVPALQLPAGHRVLFLGEGSVLLREVLPAGVSLVAAPSLAAMLASPLLKKALWQAVHA